MRQNMRDALPFPFYENLRCCFKYFKQRGAKNNYGMLFRLVDNRPQSCLSSPRDAKFVLLGMGQRQKMDLPRTSEYSYRKRSAPKCRISSAGAENIEAYPKRHVLKTY